MNAIRLSKYSALLSFSIFLVACGGGGGGGGSTGGGVTITPFTSFGAVQPNSTVSFQGSATGTNYTSNIGTGFVTSLSGTSTTAYGGSTAQETINGSGLVSSLTITPNIGISTTYTNLTNVTSGGLAGLAVYGNNTSGGVVTNEVLYTLASANGWNYQSYGVWLTGESTGSGTGGAASVGAITPVSGIPATGTATFTGNSAGFYVAATGQPYLATANMTAATNFGTRAITFNTTNTAISAFNGSGSVSSTGLNLSGTLNYSAGANTFTGNLITANTLLSGTASGQFYGPTATEIGGTYQVKAASGLQSMGGAFGGKR